MSDPRKPVEPLPPRWKPNPDPNSIVVPGLDTDASVTDQIEQIEQLITIKLQNIDENFANIHNVLANRILPSIKRYSVGTEPVREAAKFWTSFYEQAAQIRIPTFEDHSTVNEIPEPDETTTDGEEDRTARSQDSHDEQEEQRSVFEPSLAQTDASFMPSQAVSSTPATGRVANTMQSFVSEGSSQPSWANTMESPLLRLKSEIENFSADDNSAFTPAPAVTSSTSFIPPTPADRTDVTILPPSTKGKGKAKEQDPLLRNVLRHNLYANQSVDEFNSNKPVSPLKFKAKPKTPTIPKTANPYLPPDTNPSQWSGIVDLSDASALTPKTYRSGKKPSSNRDAKTPQVDDEDSDESFDGLPKGMSPPVLMSPARPPRSSAELGLLKLGQSPLKQAAARLKQDLLRDVHTNSTFKAKGYYSNNNPVESSMSTVPTPPSLSRYRSTEESDSVADSTLESMLRRVGLDGPSTAGLASTPGLRLRPKHAAAGDSNNVQSAYDSLGEDDSLPPIQNPLFTPAYMNDDDFGLDSDSADSLDMEDINNPSAAFFMASHGVAGDDDSFGSSNHSSDSLVDDDVGGIVPVHPFAGSIEDDGFDDDDDSFDYDNGETQEETLFGVPPAQRMRAAAAAAAQQQGQGGLRLLGENLLDDTIGAQIVAGHGGVAETPTPAWGNAAPFR
ncbi:hypothetical protein CC1G_00595 [Coprinopsis cinerea okayama7|uniref:DASH complex subunit ASK1 n=1 Tax=Coprinopsis cinerea (strain Okayama-7 / 130 / ATCC MYA-4618 / FGSC 9003) TaxID=240176 RepID=A8N3S4_COPC7|nr:hypothetical protein CC1G_00595 [Coprinopsis cinerea okayama7\|eukprot:XP_001829416.1 hypothetical protein CC1G_00595 [Coprinopsis cinerea okayama7\